MESSLQLLVMNILIASLFSHAYSNELQELKNVPADDSNRFVNVQIFCPIELNANIILQLEEETFGRGIEIVFGTNSHMESRLSENACLKRINHTVQPTFKQLNIFDVHSLRLSENDCIKTENWPNGILSQLLFLTDMTVHFCKRRNLNMQNLTLAHNGISNIPANIFQTQIGLINLDLSYNEIAAIDDDLFAGMEKLQVLRLSHNRLTDISR